MAENQKEPRIFNWAKERTEATKATFKGIWIAILGSEEIKLKNGETISFEKVYEANQEGKSVDINGKSIKVNGVSFQNVVKEILKDQGRLAYEDKTKTDKENEAIEKDGLKNIANESLKNIDGKEFPEGCDMSVVKTYLDQTAVDGYLPYDTVTTAGKVVGDGSHLQMGCGEGKTGVLVFAARKQVEENKQVFLTSSTSNLAQDTLDDTVRKYNKMGLLSDGKVKTIDKSGNEIEANVKKGMVLISISEIKYPNESAEKGKYVSIKINNPPSEKDKEALREAYSQPIVIADNGTIMQHKMAGAIPGIKEQGMGKDGKGFAGRTLLADEADFVLLDEYQSVQQLGEEYSQEEQKQRNDLRIEARKIITGLGISKDSNSPLVQKDDSNQYCDFTDKGKAAVIAKVEEYCKEHKEVDKQQLFDFCYEATVVELVYKQGRDYQIVNGKVVSENRASGMNMDLPQGISQALAIKENTLYENEKEVLNVTNVTSTFNEIFGEDGSSQLYISGTLGAGGSNEYLVGKENEVYNCTPKEESIRIDRRIEVKTDENRRARVVESALKNYANADLPKEGNGDKRRTVLIGCVSAAEVNQIEGEIKDKFKGNEQERPVVVKFTAASEEEFQKDKVGLSAENFDKKYGAGSKEGGYSSFNNYIKEYCGSHPVIIVGTSIMGRGTTIKTDKNMEANGGLHVIVNGLHETSSRNQIQYLARTARGSNKGTTEEFFSEEEIFEKTGQRATGNFEEDYANAYKKIDERQTNVRNNVNQLNKVLSQEIEFIKNNPRLDSNQKIAVIALLSERAVSIQTKACGNSNQAIQDRYVKEIKAFEDLYVARVSKQLKTQDGKQISEKEWLKQRGYGEIAESYIPLSGSNESKLFKDDNVNVKSNIGKQEILKSINGDEKVNMNEVRKIIEETREAQRMNAQELGGQ